MVSEANWTPDRHKALEAEIAPIIERHRQAIFELFEQVDAHMAELKACGFYAQLHFPTGINGRAMETRFRSWLEVPTLDRR